MSRRSHGDVNENMWGLRPPHPQVNNLHTGGLRPPDPLLNTLSHPQNHQTHFHHHGNGGLLQLGLAQLGFAQVGIVQIFDTRLNYNIFV